MGLFSFIGGILGGNSQKKAAKKAADAQVQAAQLGIDETRRQFDTTQQNFAPYLGAGTDALGGISDILGLNGGAAQGGAVSGVEQSPYFQSMLQQGENSILSNASATGGLRGGNVQGALAQFSPGLLDSLIQRQLGNLGGIANMGMGSAGSLGQFGANASSNISNLLGQQGQARAGSALTIGGTNAKNWQNAGAMGDDIFSAIFGGSSMGGIKL